MLGIIILAIIVVFIAVILIRTLAFKPKADSYDASGEVEVDKDAAISALQQLIKCKTVSYHDSSLEDDAEFEKLENLLPELYPEVYKTCTLSKPHKRALFFKWEGKKHDAPAVMMAHFDVVPVNEEGWEKPPFEGIIEDGVLWGRGTLDTKVTMNGVLSAANALIKEGFVPENDIYFAFSGGEEISGEGAVKIVDWFEENGITPALVVDEGGGVVADVFPGVKKDCAMIGTAEKGMLNARFTAKSSGGHASAPKRHTPIGDLSQVCCDIENNPFPMHITGPIAEMFDTLGRHSTFLYRMIFANLWLFKGVINLISKSGGDMNALLRTTVAFTQASGSSAPNVIPPEAEMVANLRINPAESVQSVKARLDSFAAKRNVTVTVENTSEPSPISETKCEAWNKVASAVAGTWKGCIVTPYLMMQASDSRHYNRVSNHVYKFSAMDLTSAERGTIHGHNERIRLEVVSRAVEFFIRLMRQC